MGVTVGSLADRERRVQPLVAADAYGGPTRAARVALGPAHTASPEGSRR